jgi:hypothetical protein
MLKLRSKDLDVIHVYKSSTHPPNQLVQDIMEMVEDDKNTLIAGDFNICYKKTPNNAVSKTLKENGFEQLVTEATHVKGGLIDHMYYKPATNENEIQLAQERYSPYYSDHDANCLTVTLTEEKIINEPVKPNTGTGRKNKKKKQKIKTIQKI